MGFPRDTPSRHPTDQGSTFRQGSGRLFTYVWRNHGEKQDDSPDNTGIRPTSERNSREHSQTVQNTHTTQP
eukprot:3756137-Amphidinium_carterae.1